MRLFSLMIVSAVLVVLPASGDVPAPPKMTEAGKWKVEFANGVIETCQIREDRTASVVEPLRNSTGTVEARGDSFVIAFADDRAKRWTPVGKKFVVEHWFPASRVPVATPVLGIAERAQ